MNEGDAKCCVFYSATVKGKRPQGRSRLKWEDNIEMKLMKLGVESVDCFNCFLVGSAGRLL